MNNTNALLLNRIFSRNTFKEIIDFGYSKTYSATVKKYLAEAGNMTNSECFSKIYKVLQDEYQNEYYYKNTLLNKLLLGIHSTKTTTALTELPIGKAKADFVLINGKAIVYEIKTDLDNFDRLASQIENYYKAFTSIVVVTSEGNYLELTKLLNGTDVGICVLTNRGHLSIRKAAVENKQFLSKKVMFKILRKNEYETIIKKAYGKLPNVSQYEMYRTCMEMFEEIDLDKAYNEFIAMLKCRKIIEDDLYKNIPYELKSVVYFSNLKRNDYQKLYNFLSN